MGIIEGCMIDPLRLILSCPADAILATSLWSWWLGWDVSGRFHVLTDYSLDSERWCRETSFWNVSYVKPDLNKCNVHMRFISVRYVSKTNWPNFLFCCLSFRISEKHPPLNLFSSKVVGRLLCCATSPSLLRLILVIFRRREKALIRINTLYEKIRISGKLAGFWSEKVFKWSRGTSRWFFHSLLDRVVQQFTAFFLIKNTIRSTNNKPLLGLAKSCSCTCIKINWNS